MILFDAVGTLIEAKPPVAEVYQRTAAEEGIKWTVPEIQDRFRVAYQKVHASRRRWDTDEQDQHSRWRKLVGDVFAGVAAAKVDGIFNRLWTHFAEPDAWSAYPDALEVIKTCKLRGIPWSIASNFDARLKRVVHGHPELSDCRYIFCSSLLGFEKPDINFFRNIQTHVGKPASELTMVGDDFDLDYLGARAAGWRSIWINRKNEPNDRRSFGISAEEIGLLTDLFENG